MSYHSVRGLSGYTTRGECREAMFDTCFDDCQAGRLQDQTGFKCAKGALATSWCVTSCTEVCLSGSCDQYPLVGTMQKGIVPANIPGVSPASSQLTAEDFPWKAYSSATEQLQYSLNQKLSHDGLCPVATDGKLGPGTCGSAQHYGAAPPTCQSFTPPKSCPGGGGEGGGGGGGGQAPSSSSSLPWILGGAAVLGLGAWMMWGRN